VRRFFADTQGATAIEYAMIAGFLSAFIVGAVNLLGANVYSAFFSKIATAMSSP
jgi:pilus assembly protein Flp/PilA